MKIVGLFCFRFNSIELRSACMCLTEFSINNIQIDAPQHTLQEPHSQADAHVKLFRSIHTHMFVENARIQLPMFIVRTHHFPQFFNSSTHKLDRGHSQPSLLHCRYSYTKYTPLPYLSHMLLSIAASLGFSLFHSNQIHIFLSVFCFCFSFSFFLLLLFPQFPPYRTIAHRVHFYYVSSVNS